VDEDRYDGDKDEARHRWRRG